MPALPAPDPRDLGLRKDLPAFLLGLLSTSFQILLLREFSAYFSGNELTLGFILAAWLLWVGLGSLAAGKMKSPPGRLPLTLLAVVLFPCALFAVRFSRFLLHTFPGEITGPSAAVLMAFGVCLPVGIPLGILFVSNVARQAGDVRRVYILESGGAVAAGFVTHFLLLLFSSSWAAASAIAATVALLSFWAERDRPSFVWALGILMLLGGFWLADFPSQRVYWRPFDLLVSRDTRYGRDQLIRANDQYTLYSNNSPVYSLPDPGAAEDSVHFAMLQSPEAGKVLLIGGGLGGALGELLKYPKTEVDYVELDPETVELSRKYAGEEEKRNLASDRVRLIFRDGRAYLRKSTDRYQVILLNLPEPATAQVNRFFTHEFFLLARHHLAPDGILAFPVPSSETAIGPELQQFLSSLFATLSQVFPEVRVVPGERNIFLASSRPLTLDPAELSRRLSSLGLATRHLEARALQFRLHELRVRYLEDKLSTGPRRLNSDFSPVSFFLNVSLWSTQFRGPGAGILRFFLKVPVPWLLGLPLLLFGLVLFALRSGKKEPVFSLLPLAVMGLTTIVTEIVLLVWFQALYGYLYGRIALLLSTFMLGLFLGAFLDSRIHRATYGRLAIIQTGFLLLLGVFRLAIPARLPEISAFFILLALGILGGGLFVASTRLYLRIREDYGRGYGLDLLGSFIGALVTSSLLIPLAGLSRVIDSVIILNMLALLFLLSRPKRNRTVN
jgi:spermidine synthase